MNQLNRTEEKIKESLDAQHFEFDEANWQGAKALLDEHLPVKRKKRKPFWIWLPLLAILGVAVYLGMPYIKTGTAPQATHTAPQDSVSSTSELITGADGNEQTDGETGNYIYDETAPLQAGDGHTVYAGEDTQAEEMELESAGGPPALQIAALAQKQARKGTGATGGNVYTRAAENNEHQVSATGNGSSGKGTGKSAKQTGNSSNSSGAGTPPPPDGDDERAQPPAQSSTNQAAPGNGQPAIQKPGTSQVTPHPGGNKPTVPPADANNALPAAGSDIKNAESGTTETDEEETSDSLTNKTGSKKKNNKPVLQKNSISPMAGINFSRVHQNGGRAYAFTPTFGILYSHYFAQKWLFRTGLAYSMVKAQLQRQYVNESYSFGFARTTATISTQSIYYLEMPLYAGYAITDKIMLLGGVNIAYRFTTGNSLTQSSEGSFQSLSASTNKENGYVKGVNPWDIQLNIGAEARIMPRLYIGAMLNGGLLNVVRNGKDTTASLNTRMQLYIKYDIFRF